MPTALLESVVRPLSVPLEHLHNLGFVDEDKG